jgi:hypothetical protein
VTRVTVSEYATAVRERYRRAGKKEKGRILDEFCAASGMHRKAATRLLGRSVRLAPVPKSKGRPGYGPALTEVLVKLWEAGDRMCGKLLVGAMAALVSGFERHGELRLGERERSALLAMSAATIDRRLRGYRRHLGRQPRRQTPATTTLKGQIPIRTWGEWKDVQSGSLQADLVLHCGESSEGFYLATLTAIDVASGWTELQALGGMHQEKVGAGLQLTRARLPFQLRELHTDNGGEFINYALRDWCLKRGVSFTRGRGYKKNDQAYVEQRNWLAVRRTVGYDRYTSRAALAALERLYALTRLQLNFLRPVRKLIDKERHGSRIRKVYDAPRSPYQRVLESGALDKTTAKRLEEQFLAINPAELQRRIELALRSVWACSEGAGRRKVG